MDTQRKLKLTLVNKFYPPDKSVTAESASMLVDFLLKNGFEVDVVCSEGQYAGGGASASASASMSASGSNKLQCQCHYVRNHYSGKNKLKRLWASIKESKAMIDKACQLNSDYIIIMTSPPLLNYYAAKAFYKTQQQWIYWSMDLYPEAFRSNNLVSRFNPIYQYIFRKAYGFAPKYLLALGEQQASYLEKCFGKSIEKSLLPCGIFEDNSIEKTDDNLWPEWKNHDGKTVLGYVGNLGEAHSITYLQELIKQFDPDKFQFVLVVYGSKAQAFLHSIRQYHNKISLLSFIPREELRYIDVHLASLKKDWLHVCVPSKLVSAVHGKSAFIFEGPQESDSWQMLGSAGWIIHTHTPIASQVSALLRDINPKTLALKKSQAEIVSIDLEKNHLKQLNKLVSFLRNAE